MGRADRGEAGMAASRSRVDSPRRLPRSAGAGGGDDRTRVRVRQTPRRLCGDGKGARPTWFSSYGGSVARGAAARLCN